MIRSETPPLVMRPPEPPGVLLSFDGGARVSGRGVQLEEGSEPVAGAGIALWSEANRHGQRACIAQLIVSAPRLRSSMLAEGAGLAYGVLFLAAACGCPGPLSILGDNLPIVRLGACNARLRSDAVWSELEDALMLLARRRWKPRWHAVRRHSNHAADAFATQG